MTNSPVSSFFASGKRDDLLLLYFAGHGFQDRPGHLYLGMEDTKKELLVGTAISDADIIAAMGNSNARQQILILDCCYSGRFQKAGYNRPDISAVVLAASDAAEFSWEGKFKHSVFTHFLIHGLLTGEADANKDGWITVDELFDYAKGKSEKYNQTPVKRYPFGGYKGRTFLAKNPSPPSDYWEPAVFDYVERLVRELSEVRDGYVPLPLEGIPVKLVSADADPSNMDDHDFVNCIAARCPVQRKMDEADTLVVLGGSGAGKTTALRFYAWSRFVQFSVKAKRLPVLLNLAATRGEKQLYEIIAAETNIPTRTIKSYIADGAIELLADGFNEIPGQVANWVSDELKKFAQEERATPNRLIVTSRPTIAQWQALATPSITIAPLEHKSIGEMIDCIAPSSLAASLLKERIALEDDIAWKERTSVLRMVRIPLVIKTLTALAGRAAEEKDATFQLPKTRGELFNWWVNFQIKSYEARTSIRSKVSAELKLDALTRLAVYMLNHRKGTSARREDISAAWDNDVPGSVLDELIDASVLQKHGNTITWWHQGIRDLRAASHLYELLKKGQFPNNYLKDREWDDSFVYLTGLLDTAAEATDLIEQLLTKDAEGQDHSFLAARCYLEICQTHDLSNIRTIVFEAISRTHRRTHEITGDIEQLEAFAHEEVEENPTFLGHLVLGKILETQARYTEAIAVFDTALTRPVPDDFNDEVDGLCHAGNARRRRAEHAEAMPFYCRALNRANDTGIHDRDDLPYYEIGYVFEKEGLTHLAHRCYDLSFQAGETTAQHFRKTAGEQKYIRKLGYANMARGVKMALLVRCYRFDGALEMSESALEVFKKAKFQRWIRNMHSVLARLYVERYQLYKKNPDLERAKHHFQRARDIAFNRNVLSLAHENLLQALLYLMQENYLEAEHLSRLAFEMMEIAEGRDQRAEVLHTLGLAYKGQAKYGESLEAFRDAIDSEPDELNRWGIARALRDLADLQHEQGMDLRDAAQNVETAKRLFEALDSLETETCQSVIDRLRNGGLNPEQYERYTRKLPRLEALLPKRPAYTPFLENGICKDLIGGFCNE